MPHILLIEISATLRHAVKKIVSNSGYDVTDVGDYSAGLEKLTAIDESNTVDAVLLGWPSKTDDAADELFATLVEETFGKVAVIVLSHNSDTPKHSWVTKRSNTALVLWEDYLETIDVLSSIVIPHSPQNINEVLANQSSGTINVLFVDDSPTVRVTYRRLLSQHGYVTDTASCVEEGMEKALQKKYDIAIIDYYMPDGTGDSLCSKIKNDPTTAHITTAIITGTYSDKAIIASLAAGAVECMFKNEPKELFVARLDAMSRSIRAMRSITKDHEHLQGILKSVGDGVYGVECDGTISFVNPAAMEILGFTEDDKLIGKSAHKLFHYLLEDGTPNPIETCQLQKAYNHGDLFRAWSTVFIHSGGDTISIECTVYPLYHDNILHGSVVAFRDVTERRLLLEELKWQATHDPLTKLPNRSYFETQLVQEVKRLQRSTESSVLLYIDLDRFKYLNDTAGHIVGDKLLVIVGNQLRSRLRSADMLARLGGDEFAIIMRNISDQDSYHAADDFRNVLEEYNFVHAGKSYKINASIGVALINSSSRAAGEVLANADIACYIAKGNGRNNTHVFQADNDEKASMDIELGWSARLHDALKFSKFELHFQPIIPLSNIDFDDLPNVNGSLWTDICEKASNKLLQFEVLLRLPDSRGNIISPDAFLPTAERFNMMIGIDRWVIKNAIEALAVFQDCSREINLSINLSGQTLDDPDLADYIRELVSQCGIKPSALVFEITETSAIANLDSANRFISELRDIGCRFALDDFGSGFCSFSHLKFLDVDDIKIDGIFIQGMIQDPVDRAIVKSIVQIAHSVGKSTVAEFVENKEILLALRQIGVDYVQGYYISKPMGSIDFETFDVDVKNNIA